LVNLKVLPGCNTICPACWKTVFPPLP